MKKNYGVDHPLKVPEIAERTFQKSRHTKCFTYDGNTFDSIPEVCFYIWCKDNNLDVEREPKDKIISFTDFKGITHIYHPDFFVKQWNRCVELKGDNHFKDKDPTKEMISFKGPQFNYIEQAKQRCMLENNVLLLTSKDYIKYQEYVFQKYGKRNILNLRKEGNLKKTNLIVSK